MRRFSAMLVGVGMLAVSGIAAADPGRADFGFYFGVPAPVYVAPPPVAYYPQPVHVAAPPVYAHRAPVHYAPPAEMHHRNRESRDGSLHRGWYRQDQH